MKKLKWFFVCGMLSAFVFTSQAANGGSVTRRGSDVLHYLIRNTISPTDYGPYTTGSMRLQVNEQGQSRKESLLLTVAGLEPNASPTLTAVLGDDPDVVTVLHLTTDQRGRVRASYMSKVPAPARQPRGTEPMPDLLSPATDIRGICIENTSLQLVGFRWIRDTAAFQYIVKRNLTPADPGGTAAGSINLVANQRRVNFRLLAGGLTPATDYSLAMNSTVVATATADENGRLQIRGWPATAPVVLDVRSLALLDAGGSPVLSTTLPR